MTDSDYPTPFRYRVTGRLPHFDDQPLIQLITFCLIDAHPHLKKGIDKQISLPELDGFLHRKLGACILANPKHAIVVEESLQHFDGVRYELHAWVIMPNHVHVLVTVFSEFPMKNVVRDWKRYSARIINQARGESCTVWQKEYHDRYMRDENHFQKAKHYVENNPVAAGLCMRQEEWRFSSAWGGRRR